MTIWITTVCEKAEKDIYSCMDYGSTRSWGFTVDREKAVRALHENRTDMWEHVYEYAVLEGYDEGTVSDIVDEPQWFKFDREKDGYFEIDTPYGAPTAYGIVLG